MNNLLSLLRFLLSAANKHFNLKRRIIDILLKVEHEQTVHAVNCVSTVSMSNI